MRTHTYQAYGLSIQSALPIPELVPGDPEGESSDVVVRYGTLAPPQPERMQTNYFIDARAEGVYYFIKEIGGVLVRAGREIIIDPLPGSVEKGFRFLVSGIAMGLLLHQRGVLTLHASAVSIAGEVAAFIGWKGMGKSTTAAALHARGHPVITDDLLVLEFERDRASVLPGFPSLKLWPEAVTAAFGDNPEGLPRVHPDATKRARSVRTQFPRDRQPLKCIYVLAYADEGTPTEIDAIAVRDAYIELIRHSFALRLLGEQGSTAVHAQQCARLVRRIPVRRLKRAHNLDEVSQIARRVEADVLEMRVNAEENESLIG